MPSPALLRLMGALIAALALALGADRRRPFRVQYAALPWRRAADGRLEVLLITARGSRRWLIPKGWPVTGLTPTASAAREAFEEAGVRGRADPRQLGGYVYAKGRRRGRLIRVAVFPLEVTEQADRWPEGRQRDRRWAQPHLAAELIRHRALAELIRGFDPTAPSLG